MISVPIIRVIAVTYDSSIDFAALEKTPQIAMFCCNKQPSLCATVQTDQVLLLVLTTLNLNNFYRAQVENIHETMKIHSKFRMHMRSDWDRSLSLISEDVQVHIRCTAGRHKG